MKKFYSKTLIEIGLFISAVLSFVFYARYYKSVILLIAGITLISAFIISGSIFMLNFLIKRFCSKLDNYIINRELKIRQELKDEA